MDRKVASPSDSVTTTVKKRTAPFTSLNQLQSKEKKMDDLLTADAGTLTRVDSGGMGGPSTNRGQET